MVKVIHPLNLKEKNSLNDFFSVFPLFNFCWKLDQNLRKLDQKLLEKLV